MPSPPDPLVTGFFLLVSLFQLGAAVVAIVLARRRLEHRPIAAFLAFQVGANAAHELLRVLVLVPARASSSAPFTGWTRVAGHLTTALGLTWPAGLAAVVLVVMLKWRPSSALGAVASVWLAVALGLASTYPAMRGELLERALLAAELGAVAVGVGGTLTWLLRRVEKPRSEHVAVVMLLVAELSALVVGPWRTGDIFHTWPMAQVAYATIYAALVTLQGGYVWLSSSK